MKINRIVDRPEDKKIIAVTDKGRKILFEGEDYPKDGVLGLTKAKFEKRLAEVLLKEKE
jgi:hypothetical protein